MVTLTPAPADIVEAIKSRFHASKRDRLQVGLDSKNRPGFLNWDGSHFTPCGLSVDEFRESLRHPPKQAQEDAQGLGYYN